MLISSQEDISLNGGLEEGLVALEEHARLNGYLLIQVQPSPVSAALTLVAVLEHPLSLVHVEIDHSLHLRQQFIINTDIAVWTASNDDFLLFELAAVQVRLVALAHREYAKAKFRRRLRILQQWITIPTG